MKISVLAFAATFAFSGAATAATIDFENYVGDDPTNLGTSFTWDGVRFSSTETMRMVRVGRGTHGFAPNDTPRTRGAFGNWFITGDFNRNTNMMLSFGSAQSAISFDIADIDGAGRNQEEFVVEYLLGDASVGVQRIDGTSVRGNAAITPFSFDDDLFDTVRITGTTPSGTRNIGWGLDNITVAPILACSIMRG